MWISTILPPVTVKASTEANRPPGGRNDPRGPVHEGRSCERAELGEGKGQPGDVGSAPDHTRCARRHRPGVGPEHDIRVEHREERVEMPVAGGGEERVDDLSLTDQIGIRNRGGPLDAAPSAACELSRRGSRAPHDGGDLVEGHVEDVVEHEAGRSAGARVSRTTSSARPTESVLKRDTVVFAAGTRTESVRVRTRDLFSGDHAAFVPLISEPKIGRDDRTMNAGQRDGVQRVVVSVDGLDGAMRACFGRYTWREQQAPRSWPRTRSTVRSSGWLPPSRRDDSNRVVGGRTGMAGART